jgi:hypothetical protein
MKLPGFEFDYVRIRQGIRPVLTINDEKRFVGRVEMLRVAAWFVRSALFPRRAQ